MASVLSLSEALLGRLESSSAFTTYDAVVPDTPVQAYVVAYPSSGFGVSDNYAAQRSRLRWQCYVICVGRSRRQAANTADLVRTLLSGWRIDDSPAASSLTEVELNAQILRDDSDTRDTRFSLTLLFRVTTTRS